MQVFLLDFSQGISLGLLCHIFVCWASLLDPTPIGVAGDSREPDLEINLVASNASELPALEFNLADFSLKDLPELSLNDMLNLI